MTSPSPTFFSDYQKQALAGLSRSGFARFSIGRWGFEVCSTGAGPAADLSCRGFWSAATESEAREAVALANGITRNTRFSKLTVDTLDGEAVASVCISDLECPTQFFLGGQSLIDAIRLFMFELRKKAWSAPELGVFRRVESGCSSTRQGLKAEDWLSSLQRLGCCSARLEGPDIVFGDSGRTYTITLDGQDPSYFQLDCLDFLTLDDSVEQEAAAYRAANEVNRFSGEAKVLVCRQRKSVSLSFQALCPCTISAVPALIERSRAEIDEAADEFFFLLSMNFMRARSRVRLSYGDRAGMRSNRGLEPASSQSAR